VFYPFQITVNRATAHLHSKVLGEGQYLGVFGHVLSHDQPCRPAPAIFEVLEVATADGGPRTPEGGGLVYLEHLGEGLVRCPLLIAPLDDMLDRIHSLPDRWWDSGLNALGNEVSD
jgi:hypothetical protein